MAVSLRSTDLRGQQTAAKRASHLAERQFGAIARRQLIAVGFSEARVRSWHAGGRLHLRYPGVYAFGRRDLGTEGQLSAALLFAGGGAALSGLTALWWMGLLGRRPDLIHVDAPGRKRSIGDLAIRHPRTVERVWHRRLPSVPLPQALLRATESLTHDSLRLVLARADFQHVLSLPALHAAIGRGRAGSDAVRRALNSHLPQLARCTNPLEVDFVLLCERFGIEIPEPNARVGRYRPDMLWREARLIVELDGEDAHSSPAQIQADERRQAALEAMGHRVLRFTWDGVHRSSQQTAASVRSAIIGACGSPLQPTR